MSTTVLPLRDARSLRLKYLPMQHQVKKLSIIIN